MSSLIGTVKGSVALITGGGSGLGLATVQRLIREGARGVIAFDRKFDSQTGQQTSQQIIQVTGDVTSEDDVNKALETCDEKFGKLDVVVNCAGIGIAERLYHFGKKQPHSFDSFRKVIQVNTLGTFNVCRLAVGLIGRNDPVNTLKGVIINTASVAAFDGQIGQVAYAASKGAIASMTLPIARDLAFQGIRCVAIAPGLFDTPLLASLPEKVRLSLAETIPCPKRLGHPEEYAHLVQMIIENPMINGEVIRLDGALRMQP